MNLYVKYTYLYMLDKREIPKLIVQSMFKKFPELNEFFNLLKVKSDG